MIFLIKEHIGTVFFEFMVLNTLFCVNWYKKKLKALFIALRSYVMELNGKIVQLLPEKSGESAKGPWRKQEYIIETEGQYPKQVCFMVWSDKIDEFAIKEGEQLIVSVDLESREFNGRWYTDVKAWKIDRAKFAEENALSSSRDYEANFQSEGSPESDDEIPF